MIKIIYPEDKPRIKTLDDKDFVFCLVRKKWILLTPEEWVRQNFMLYLTKVLNYSRLLIAVEKKIKVGELAKRFDIVVYDKNIQPLIVVECKEAGVPLSANTLQQILRYNIKLDAALLIITNGNSCFAFSNTTEGFNEIDEIPAAK